MMPEHRLTNSNIHCMRPPTPDHHHGVSLHQMAMANLDTTGKSTAELARHLRRMKRRLFLELANSNGNGSVDDYTHRFQRHPSNSSIGSTASSALLTRTRLSRSDSDASGLFLSSRSIESLQAGDENVEI
jgi:hypothetical protein